MSQVNATYVHQVPLPGRSLRYRWDGWTLTATLLPDGAAETFDFSGLAPGDRVVEFALEKLSFSPVVSAEVDEQGILRVALLSWEEENGKTGR